MNQLQGTVNEKPAQRNQPYQTKQERLELEKFQDEMEIGERK